jgi:multiple sugar transport system ATP-binding protein
MASIQIKGGVKYRKDGTINLSNFNMDIANGEFVALVGPKGSGKTTVANVIAGLDSLYKGEILINGNRVNEVVPQKRKVALVLPHQGLYPDKTVYENMSVSLRLCETPSSQIGEKINSIAETLMLKYLLFKKPDELSQEETLKVLLARGVLRNPQVLIVNYPFSNIEVQERLKYLSLLQEIHKKTGLTMILITEDRYVAKKFAGRIVVLNNGFVQQTGEAALVSSRPDNLFVASFLALPRMNICNGTLQFENGMFFIELGGRKVLFRGNEKLKKQINKETVVGIRPQMVQLLEERTEHAFTGTAERVEHTAYGELITINNGDFAVTVPNVLHALEGDKLHYTLSGEQVLLFDKETGKNIL